jgi:hypothetical protein
MGYRARCGGSAQDSSPQNPSNVHEYHFLNCVSPRCSPPSPVNVAAEDVEDAPFTAGQDLASGGVTLESTTTSLDVGCKPTDPGHWSGTSRTSGAAGRRTASAASCAGVIVSGWNGNKSVVNIMGPRQRSEDDPQPRTAAHTMRHLVTLTRPRGAWPRVTSRRKRRMSSCVTPGWLVEDYGAAACGCCKAFVDVRPVRSERCLQVAGGTLVFGVAVPVGSAPSVSGCSVSAARRWRVVVIPRRRSLRRPCCRRAR